MFPDHMNSIKNNNSTNSNYTQHILEMNHKHETVENTVDVLQITGKWKHVNTLKKFRVWNLSKQN
jgi:hypothetical protein